MKQRAVAAHRGSAAAAAVEGRQDGLETGRGRDIGGKFEPDVVRGDVAAIRVVGLQVPLVQALLFEMIRDGHLGLPERGLQTSGDGVAIGKVAAVSRVPQLQRAQPAVSSRSVPCRATDPGS